MHAIIVGESMILDVKRVVEKISSGDEEVILEAWDSQRKILAISLVRDYPVESFTVKFNNEGEVLSFINYLSSNKNVKKEQVERFKNMLKA